MTVCDKVLTTVGSGESAQKGTRDLFVFRSVEEMFLNVCQKKFLPEAAVEAIIVSTFIPYQL